MAGDSGRSGAGVSLRGRDGSETGSSVAGCGAGSWDTALASAGSGAPGVAGVAQPSPVEPAGAACGSGSGAAGGETCSVTEAPGAGSELEFGLLASPASPEGVGWAAAGEADWTSGSAAGSVTAAGSDSGCCTASGADPG